MNAFFADESFHNKSIGQGNKKLRIGFIVGSFPAISQTFILNQITDIIRRGYDISIYSLQRSNDKSVHPKVNEFGLLEKTTYASTIPETLFGRIKSSLARFSYTFKGLKFFMQMISARQFGWNNIVPFRRIIWGLDLVNYVKKEKLDILHIHFGDNALVPVCAKSCGFLGDIKIIVSFHGYDLHNIRMGTYDKLFETGHVFTVNSNYSKNKLLDLGCPMNKIIRLPVGLDCSVFTPVVNCLDRKENLIRIIYIGRLTEFKGVINALHAFAQLKNKSNYDLYLDIVGDGELRQKTIETIEMLEIKNDVVLHGSLESDRIIPLMNNADIFLFPGITASDGRQENQGLVIQEAQAMGLPVVVTDFGGVSEGMIDGKTGYALPEGDIGAIVEKLEKLISRPELRSQMGTAGGKYVRENFDSAIVGNRLERIYLEVASW